MNPNSVTYIDNRGWLHLRNKQLLFARSKKGKTIFHIPGSKREPSVIDGIAKRAVAGNPKFVEKA